MAYSLEALFKFAIKLAKTALNTRSIFPKVHKNAWTLASALLLLMLNYSCTTAKTTLAAKPLHVNTVVKEPEIIESIVTQEPPTEIFGVGALNFNGYSKLLEGKRVGVLTNQSAVVEGKNLVDFLIEKGVNLTKIYAPEHGFRGTADNGELISDGKDSKTNLPIISLYGDKKKPTPEQLDGIDIMVFDLQDVGVRFYTYISSLHYLMEACAEKGIAVVVLDRPNPNGKIVDGPILEPEKKSFVGMHPVPVLHGMTIGEYARMINGEGWLANGKKCMLFVIACSGYLRDMPYSLPVRPSPNLPNDLSINLYASLCLFEGTNVSVGRGTDKQFQIFGSPYLSRHTFCFTPEPNLGSKNPPYNGKDCYGEDLSEHPFIDRLELKWLLQAYKDTPDKSKFFTSYFERLAGTAKLQEQIESGMSASEIRATWESGLIEFKNQRQKYLIYQSASL